MVDVGRNDGPAPRDLVPDEFRRHMVGDGRAERLAVARRLQRRFAAQVLADRDIFHLRRHDAAPGIGQLGDGGTRLRPEGTPARCRELLKIGRLAAPQAVVFRLDLPAVIGFHIAARLDPARPQRRQAARDVDGHRRIAVGAGAVIDPHGSLAAAGLKIDLAQRHAQVGIQTARRMDLARRGQGSGRNREYRLLSLGISISRINLIDRRSGMQRWR